MAVNQQLTDSLRWSKDNDLDGDHMDLRALSSLWWLVCKNQGTGDDNTHTHSAHTHTYTHTHMLAYVHMHASDHTHIFC